MKIISFSLWGKDPVYTVNSIKNSDIALDLFPEWECWFYISPNVPKVVVSELQKRKNTKCIIMDNDESWNGMFWRFYSAEKSLTKNDAMISRDSDSLLNVRDKACIDEWLFSDKDFHIIRDNCAHNVPILGGMWGCRNGILKDMRNMINSYNKKESNNRKNIDQEFLWEKVYPLVKNHSMIHDAYNFLRDGAKSPPILRKGPWRLSDKPQDQDWPDIKDPWRTININGLMYCGNCNMVHDNDYIGKFNLYFTESDKGKYPFNYEGETI